MSEEEFYSKALSFDEVGKQVDIFEKEKIKYQQQIYQLTNNWNKLEEWAKKQMEEKKYGNDFERWGAYSTILDKMKEIKEENK